MNNKEQAQEYLNNIKANNYDRNEIIEWLYNYDIENGANFEIVTAEEMDDLVKHECDNGGFQRVAYFIAGIDWLNDEYYRIDGYGNAKEITEGDLECWLEDIKNGYYE